MSSNLLIKGPASRPAVTKTEITPGVFVATSGYVNDLVNSLDEGATLMLDPTVSWTFGPAGAGNHMSFVNTDITIIGNGVTIIAEAVSTIPAPNRVALDNVTIQFNGDPNHVTNGGFLTIVGHLYIAGDVELVSQNDRDETPTVLFLVKVSGSTSCLKVGGGNSLRIRSLEGPATDRLLCVDAGTVDVDGTLAIGTELSATTGAIADTFAEPALTLLSTFHLTARGIIYVVGYVVCSSLQSGTAPNVHRIANLQINTGAVANASALYLLLGPTTGEMLCSNLRIFIQKLSLHRNRGTGTESAQPAIKAVPSTATDFATLDTLAGETDIITPATDGFTGGDGDNHVYIARVVQTGYANTGDTDDRYNGLTTVTAGINSATERATRLV